MDKCSDATSAKLIHEATAIMVGEMNSEIERKKNAASKKRRYIIQSLPEIPAIAHFCSLFYETFDLLEFDIEELEDSFLQIGCENDTSQLVIRLILKLLKGCKVTCTRNINPTNFNEYLRRLFRLKNEKEEKNAFKFECKEFLNDNIDFHNLSLRNRVRIVKWLTDYRLCAEDAYSKVRSLKASSLRVEALGKDANGVVYWYFYGTRLYKEKPNKIYVPRDKKDNCNGKIFSKKACRRVPSKNTWSLACSTIRDWENIGKKYKNSRKRCEKELYEVLNAVFLPEIKKMFNEKNDNPFFSMNVSRASSRIEKKRKVEEYTSRWGQMTQTSYC